MTDTGKRSEPERVACVNLDEFPLQLLLGRRPDWRSLPAAVVDRENAQGVIQWVNRHARARRILPGMRYAAALSLSRQLRAGAVSDTEIGTAIDRLAERLRAFTADVEPSRHEPGVFWLGASGLSLIFPSLDRWADSIVSMLGAEGFSATAAVGFTRFGTYASAKTIEDAVVFAESDDERAHAAKVPIERLGFTPQLRDRLARLGITTLGGFLDLPSAGVRKRFGDDVHRLHRMAKGQLFSPLQPRYPVEPASGTAVFDFPEFNLDRLMAVIEQILEPVIATLAGRSELLAALNVSFTFDNARHGSGQHERVEPAGPTLEAGQILDLVRLRLEGTPLSGSGGVAEIALEAESTATSHKQRDLFEQHSPRDMAAANRALARVRADMGDDSVVFAKLREGHLPEASFEWEPARNISTPAPRNVELRPLVRRIYSRPLVLSRRRLQEPGAALVTLYEDRLVEERIGPHVVTGGWWVREVGREYYYVRTETGRRLWIYYDRRRRCWFLHGEVE